MTALTDYGQFLRDKATGGAWLNGLRLVVRAERCRSACDRWGA